MKPCHFIVILSIVLTTTYSGCKKETVVVPTCLCTSFTSATDTNATPNLIEWTADGKMKRLTLATPYIYEATYLDGIIQTDWYATYDSNYHSQVIFYLNQQGYIAKEVNIAQNGQRDSITYEYNANGEMTKKKVANASGSYTRTYVWSGGNIASFTTTGSSTASAVYEYFTDKTYTGRARIYFEKYYGKLCANPERRSDFTSSAGVTSSTLYGYTFDGRNNITKETIIDSDGALTTYTYTYECK